MRFLRTVLAICAANLVGISMAAAQVDNAPHPAEFFAIAGAGLYTQTCHVIASNERTLACYLPSNARECASAEARVPRRFRAILGTLVGGANCFVQFERFGVGPMIRVGLLQEHSETGGSIYDSTSGLVTFSAALGATWRF